MARRKTGPPRPPLRPDGGLSEQESEILREAAGLLSVGNAEEAVPTVRSLASGGSGRAQVFLGWIYASGACVDPDREVARRWYRESAKSGDRVGQYYHALGILQEARERGETEEPSEDALYWLRRSGDQGYAPALVREGALGVWSGELDRAYSCMRRAAELGHPMAPIWLARRALIGGGVREFLAFVGAVIRSARMSRKIGADEFYDENLFNV